MQIVSTQHPAVSGGVVWPGPLRGGRRQEVGGWGQTKLKIQFFRGLTLSSFSHHMRLNRTQMGQGGVRGTVSMLLPPDLLAPLIPCLLPQ